MLACFVHSHGKCLVGCFRFRVVVAKSVETSKGGGHLGHVFRGQHVGCFRFRVVVTKSVETSGGGRLPPEGRRPPGGGVHLGHVFRGQS